MTTLMAVYSLVYLSWLPSVFTNQPQTSENPDLDLVLWYKDFVVKESAKYGCTRDYELSGLSVVFDYSLWEREVNLANNIANYLTTMWRYKNTQNYSLVENEASMYSLVRSTVISSKNVYGSMICFEEGRFRRRHRFCPYAYKNRNESVAGTRVFDLGVKHDYLNETNFLWWQVARTKGLKNKPKSNTDYYDVDLSGYVIASARGMSKNNISFFNVSTQIVTSNDGVWSTIYYDCFGGKTWIMSYLAPFYNEKSQFLGAVRIDMKLDTIELDQCDLPQDRDINEARKQWVDRELTFYGTHRCKNQSTKCVHVPGNGFTAGSYRCVCRKGYYFPVPGAKRKYFDGKKIHKVYTHNKSYYGSMFDCLPCAEGCSECVDNTPCMYPRNTSLKTTFLVLNEVIKLFAIGLGLFIFMYREHKIIKASSPVFMAIIVSGIILMYFEISLGYLEASLPVCISQAWLYHTGFVLAFGSLLLKTWRIVVIFRLRSAKMIELTDMALLKYLAIMMAAILVYLMIWTWTSTQDFEIVTTNDGLKYKRCVHGWFSNAISIGRILFLAWGVWLCLQVRNAPSAYNESKYIAWCIYNSVFIMILVGILRILLDYFHNPDVSYAVDFLAIHVVATILLVLLFVSKIFLLRNYNRKSSKAKNLTLSVINSATDLRRSPFRLNRLADGTFAPEVEEENDVNKAENKLLREEIRSLNAHLAVYEKKEARQNRRKETLSTDESSENQPENKTGSQSADPGSPKNTGNDMVVPRREKSGSLLEDIRNTGTCNHKSYSTSKNGRYLAVPLRKSVSDESLTVASTVSNES